MFKRYSYAYHHIRGWYVAPIPAMWLSLRYWFTGDTGKFRTHWGLRITRLRLRTPDDED